MSIIGATSEWADLIEPMVPVILDLVVTSWQQMPLPGPEEKEDNITTALCQILMQNRTARGLMFQVRTQVVELEPMPGEDIGRLDIAFIPLIPREDIYFCLESKRLNVVKNGVLRAYASEYVRLGMMRFVTGQYSRMVRHGGMIGYVLNGKISDAMTNVEANIRERHKELCMNPPGAFQSSTVQASGLLTQETHHQRVHEKIIFRIHHLFMAPAISAAP
ncbi:MAG TPA: hypothetical protein VG649_25565 [Candidatus Angelobacter sp.]|nr:hypothetical protein [Candidatus Angelobacter sp.]